MQWSFMISFSLKPDVLKFSSKQSPTYLSVLNMISGKLMQKHSNVKNAFHMKICTKASRCSSNYRLLARILWSGERPPVSFNL